MGYEISIGLVHNIIYVGYTSFFSGFTFVLYCNVLIKQ